MIRYDLQRMAKLLRPRVRGIRLLPRIVPTIADEQALREVYLTRVVDRWAEALAESVVPIYTVAPPDGVVFDTDAVQLQTLINEIEQQILSERRFWTGGLGRWTSGVLARQSQRFISGVRNVTGVDVAPYFAFGDFTRLMEARIAENVALITNLNAQTADRVRRTLLQAYQGRWTQATLSAELTRVVGMSRRRADLIARDQTSKLYGQLTRYRSEQAGLTRFRWDTRLDSRVRDSHRALEGRTFTWASGAPPRGIFPGQEVNCRCVAQSVVDYTGPVPAQEAWTPRVWQP